MNEDDAAAKKAAELIGFYKAVPTSEIVEFLSDARAQLRWRAKNYAPLRRSNPADVAHAHAVVAARRELNARIPHRDPDGRWFKAQKEKFMNAPTTHTHRATCQRARGLLTYGMVNGCGIGIWKPDRGDEQSFSWTKVSIDNRRRVTFDHWHGTARRFTLAKKDTK